MELTLIRTGGTIGCEVGADGVIAPADVTVPHLSDFDVTVVTPFYELSERLETAHYSLLIKTVSDAARRGAVLITHGSDTLPFTAGVVAFALGGIQSCVVFVSSDKPLIYKDAGGHASLKTAAQFLKTGSCGVYVADRETVHFATRLLEARAFDGAYFSACDRVCAQCVNGEIVFKEKPQASSPLPPLQSLSGKDIVCIRPYPNLNYDRIVTEGASCVLHDGYHSGTANDVALNRFAQNCGCDIYVTGGSRGVVYSSKADFDKRLKVYDNVTFPAMYAKLLVGLNRFDDRRQLDDYLAAGQCGEFF